MRTGHPRCPGLLTSGQVVQPVCLVERELLYVQVIRQVAVFVVYVYIGPSGIRRVPQAEQFVRFEIEPMGFVAFDQGKDQAAVLELVNPGVRDATRAFRHFNHFDKTIIKPIFVKGGNTTVDRL